MSWFAPLTRAARYAVAPVVFASAFVGGLSVNLTASAQAAQTTAAPQTPDAGSYTLKKRVFTVGESNRFRVAGKAQMNGMPLEFTMVFKELTKSAKPTGEFTILTQFESAVANIAGAEQDISAFMPVVTTARDKDGKYTVKTDGGLEQVNDIVGPLPQRFATIADNFLPEKPVKVGDTWPVKAEAPSLDGGVTKTEGDATLVGLEVLNGVKSLKIKVSAKVIAKDDQKPGEAESLLFIDAATNKLLKFTSTVTTYVKGEKVPGEMQITALAAKDEKKPDTKDTKAAGTVKADEKGKQ